MSITYYCALKYFSITRAAHFRSFERRNASSRARARRRSRDWNARCNSAKWAWRVD